MNQHYSIFFQTDCHRVGRGVAFRMGETLKVMAVIGSLHEKSVTKVVVNIWVADCLRI